MVDILSSLFGSRARLRVLRFFLLNPAVELTSRELAQKIMIPSPALRRELMMLEKIGMIKSRKLKGTKRFRANEEFALRDELLALVAHATIAPECKSLARLEKIGDVHLVLISGVFINYSKARADLFIVANNVSRIRLAKAIHALEAEIGRELRYVLLSTEELKYRLNMTDRFLRDFLSGAHEEVVNKIPRFKSTVAGLRKK